MAEKRHIEITGEEAQRLGSGRVGPNEARALRARLGAQRAWAELVAAEEAAAAAPKGEYEDRQMRADAQLHGRYFGKVGRDADTRRQLSEARNRIAMDGERRGAAEALAAAQANYERAVGGVAMWEREAASESKQRAISLKQRELAAAAERARTDPRAAAEVTRISHELTTLAQQS